MPQRLYGSLYKYVGVEAICASFGIGMENKTTMLKQKKAQRTANCYNKELRDIIAWRITSERHKRFPQHGGAGKCAKEFGLSVQQWSQYENGRRTPGDDRLKEIADHFDVSPEHLKTAPENWEAVRLEWLNKSKPGRKRVAARATNGFDDGPSANTVVSEPSNASQNNSMHGSIPIVELIQKIIDVENMHEQGKIPTTAYEKAMGTIDALVSLVVKSQAK